MVNLLDPYCLKYCWLDNFGIVLAMEMCWTTTGQDYAGNIIMV